MLKISYCKYGTHKSRVKSHATHPLKRYYKWPAVPFKTGTHPGGNHSLALFQSAYITLAVGSSSSTTRHEHFAAVRSSRPDRRRSTDVTTDPAGAAATQHKKSPRPYKKC
ncbi:hypothetical protein FQR65_LT02461 [Abscondita terminalis]|nr:hypothetical protein FQR65_LT02461 [Abscondita terminalis]